jgi:carotenoid 1,2-hydratase
VIAFIGSVFSPYYAWARRRGEGDPYNHCAVNVALYGPRSHRWAMTERPRGAVQTFARALRIGSSGLTWDGNALTVNIDETTAPLPSRIRGVVRLHPVALATATTILDDSGGHRWSPIAPSARVEVELEEPSLRWCGSGYLDSNEGSGPLEDSFSGWNWSRSDLGRQTAVCYDVVSRDGRKTAHAMAFDRAGHAESFEPPPVTQLRGSGWRIDRQSRAEDGDIAVLRTLEDGPFYARSLLSARMLGVRAPAIHESLSLDRFRAPVVKAMLPFRMPRWPL